MRRKTITIHAGTVFDSKARKFRDNVFITVNQQTGAITEVAQRQGTEAILEEGDIDLRDKVVMPGFVDAHTHVFLHAYRYGRILRSVVSELSADTRPVSARRWSK